MGYIFKVYSPNISTNWAISLIFMAHLYLGWKLSKTIIKVQECFREAYNFLSSGNKKTPITALFSHLKHPFTKVNFLVSNASKDLFLTFSHKPL
jgi:hypothetical protein